jgi:hypothetical protein
MGIARAIHLDAGQGGSYFSMTPISANLRQGWVGKHGAVLMGHARARCGEGGIILFNDSHFCKFKAG